MLAILILPIYRYHDMKIMMISILIISASLVKVYIKIVKNLRPHQISGKLNDI